jgi:hypothetical protein
MAFPAKNLRKLFTSSKHNSDGTSQNEYNRKFGPPLEHPLEAESKLRHIVPLDSERKEFKKRELQRNSVREDNPATYVAFKQMLAELNFQEQVDEYDEMFAKDFLFFLAGKSKLNDPLICPWGTKDLFHLPEVWQYFRSYIAKREEFRLALVQLNAQCRSFGGPRTLNEAYLWKKYIGGPYQRFATDIGGSPIPFESSKRYPFYTMDDMIHFLDVFKQPPKDTGYENANINNNVGFLGSNEFAVVRPDYKSPTDETAFIFDNAGPRTNDEMEHLNHLAHDGRTLEVDNYVDNEFLNPHQPSNSSKVADPIITPLNPNRVKPEKHQQVRIESEPTTQSSSSSSNSSSSSSSQPEVQQPVSLKGKNEVDPTTNQPIKSEPDLQGLNIRDAAKKIKQEEIAKARAEAKAYEDAAKAEEERLAAEEKRKNEEAQAIADFNAVAAVTNNTPSRVDQQANNNADDDSTETKYVLVTENGQAHVLSPQQLADAISTKKIDDSPVKPGWLAKPRVLYSKKRQSNPPDRYTPST